MPDKITLDIDFDDEIEPVKDIPISTIKSNQSNDVEVKEELLKIINYGLKICEKNSQSLDDVLDNIEIFLKTGVNEDMIHTLSYLSEIFKTIVPSLLVGDYEEIILNTTNYNLEEDTAMLKKKRRQLLKKVQDYSNIKNNK